MDEDIKKVLDEYSKETKRHFDVVAEDLKDQIQIVAEQVASNTEDITSIKDNVEIIKSDISIIKNDLMQKVSREEFVVLEKRIGILESKVNK